MRLFHFHLAAADYRAVEARYVACGFRLVARYGRLGRESTSFDAGHGWDELDAIGFRLRLTQLERDGIELVVQPGRWELPLVDHVGVLLDGDELDAVLRRAKSRRLTVQERGDRRTFVSTGTGLRLEVRRESDGDVAPFSLELATAEPERMAGALAELLGLEPIAGDLDIAGSTVHFRSGGPAGRPQLVAAGF